MTRQDGGGEDMIAFAFGGPPSGEGSRSLRRLAWLAELTILPNPLAKHRGA
jgi:hypothetical protein